MDKSSNTFIHLYQRTNQDGNDLFWALNHNDFNRSTDYSNSGFEVFNLGSSATDTLIVSNDSEDPQDFDTFSFGQLTLNIKEGVTSDQIYYTNINFNTGGSLGSNEYTTSTTIDGFFEKNPIAPGSGTGSGSGTGTNGTPTLFGIAWWIYVMAGLGAFILFAVIGGLIYWKIKTSAGNDDDFYDTGNEEKLKGKEEDSE